MLINLLHTLVFASLPPNIPLELTLQNNPEESVFSRRGSEERQRLWILVLKEEVQKQEKDQLKICHVKSKWSSISIIYNICQWE